jgi:anthranilate synthase component I
MTITREIPADQLTPVTAYANLKQKGTCLLESTVAGVGGRHSLIGIEPVAAFTARGQKSELKTPSGVETFEGDPYEILSTLEKRFGLPAVGFVTYDAVRGKENIPARHPDLFHLPDFFFQFYRTSILFDHERTALAITAESEAEIDSLLEKMMAGKKLPLFGAKADIEVECDLTDAEYGKMVEKAKKHLVAGDVFQIVLSRTFKVKTAAEPLQIYRALRQTSPAPYLFFFEFDDFAIAGASPEKIISVENREIESTPIAGTCGLSGSIEKLLSDPKESAEHVMLVDLARNDLGAVSLSGTVKVASYKQPVRFSHLTHIVSRVIGKLDPKFSSLDAFKASFPAGTLSGAPKVRAMELIDELESSRRGLYGGSIVSLDGKGNLKSCIAIRMAFIKDGVAYIRAGAGIVLDSDPQKEADESRLKASTVLDALNLAAGAK